MIAVWKWLISPLLIYLVLYSIVNSKFYNLECNLLKATSFLGIDSGMESTRTPTKGRQEKTKH